MAELTSSRPPPPLDEALALFTQLIERRPLLHLFVRKVERAQDGPDSCLRVYCEGPGEFTYGGSLRCPLGAPHGYVVQAGDVFLDELERGFAREYRLLESLTGPESIA